MDEIGYENNRQGFTRTDNSRHSKIARTKYALIPSWHSAGALVAKAERWRLLILNEPRVEEDAPGLRVAFLVQANEVALAHADSVWAHGRAELQFSNTTLGNNRIE